MSRRGIMKSNEQLSEDYGTGGIIFPFIELWVLLSTILMSLFFMFSIKNAIILFIFPIIPLLSLFALFKIFDIIDIMNFTNDVRKVIK